MADCKYILKEGEMARTIERLAYELMERHTSDTGGGCEQLALIGIQRRGVDLAARIKAVLDAKLGLDLPMGSLDINLYRDDWTSLDLQPQISETDIPFALSGRDIVLVDDVLFTGRTIRSALEALMDFGRPRRVELMVLVDRGHRELPIHADYVGKTVNTAREEHVDVYVKEKDGADRVCLT